MTTSTLEDKVRFDIIRYANCWEDADILVDGLNIKEGGRYLSIASAGDNTFSIISRGAGRVIAVDLNATQIACTEIRAAAFKRLTYDELKAFIGVSQMRDRVKIYQKLRVDLSDESKNYWDANLKTISKGIIFAGKFEKYFGYFRKWILPFIHPRSRVKRLLADKSASEQHEFYNKHWNSWRWRFIFKLFFSRIMMGRLGRDPEFFNYVEGDVASRILARAEYALTELSTHDNPYLQFILNGHFNGVLPHYLRPENYKAIRENIDALELRKSTVAEVFKTDSDCRYDGFNLSDIFEYMSRDEYLRELELIAKHSNRGARVVYWNMLADRKHPQELHNILRPLTQTEDSLFAQDKAFFYKAFVIEEVK